MAKTKTHPWDPADHIVDGEHVLVYLKTVTPDEYDPVVTPFFLDCIARSKGLAEITVVSFNEKDSNRAVTVTTTSGASTTLAIAPEVDVDSIRRALTPAPTPTSP